MQTKITDQAQIAKIWEAIGETGTAPTQLTVSCPKADTPPKPCACGCGEVGPSTWRPGHDAKRKSHLFAEYRSGDAKRRAAAIAELTKHDWPVPNAKQDRKPTAKTA